MATIVEMNDLSAPELAVFSKLTQRQLRNKLSPDDGLFIAESPKVISVALDNGYTPISLLMEKRHISGDAAQIICRCPDIPVYTAAPELLEELTGYRLTRGVLCAMQRPAPLSIADVTENACRIAVLDGIVDSTNIGSIFRSAAALGMDGIILTNTCCDPLSRRSVRVSMGAVFQIPWVQLPANYPKYTDILKQYGFKNAAMALRNNAVSIDDKGLLSEDRIAVILGSEGNGLSPDVIDSCDYTVCIPMYHGVDSLNVGTAASLAFWQLCRGR